MRKETIAPNWQKKAHINLIYFGLNVLQVDDTQGRISSVIDEAAVSFKSQLLRGLVSHLQWTTGQ